MSDDFDSRRESFFRKYPDCPVSEPIKSLNLVMRREYAEAIVRGEKKVEYRAFSPHYESRLYDKKVVAYGDAHIADEDIQDFFDFAVPLRIVEKIHFHPYDNSWSLDVECIGNGTATPCKDDVEFLEEEYGDTELKDMQREFDSRNEATERPIFFFFALGKILESNL